MTISTDTSTVTARSGITGAFPPFVKPRGSFGDHDPVAFGIRDHALVVSVARPPWPIEKREPVALQSFGKGVDRGFRQRRPAHRHNCVRYRITHQGNISERDGDGRLSRGIR